MELPFSRQEFLQLFASYNEAVWPMQFAAYGLAVTMLIWILLRLPSRSRFAGAVLALFWATMGSVYHLAFFSRINDAAYVFGGLFLVQAALFLVDATVLQRLSFRPRWDVYALVGAAFVLYAMVVYPVLGAAFGHVYPRAPMFGVAPCPTTIFTFGVLLWTDRPVPRVYIAIPFAWSLLGVSAALKLGIYEDLGLVVAGVFGTALLLLRDWRRWQTRPDAVVSDDPASRPSHAA
jgi:hypothetical protein